MGNGERFTVIASSLGSYFGVGFVDPQTQLLIDLGVIENTFDDDAIERMELGTLMEDATLNVLERRLGIGITNRNTEVLNCMEGRFRVKLDGETVLNGEPTVVEAKYSNSNASPFTKNKGYEFQCQAYMMATGYSQALLGGIYKGKPIWRIIKRDDDMIADIRVMVEAVYSILNGMTDVMSFPNHLIGKYSGLVIPETLDEFEEVDTILAERLVELNAKIKDLENEKESLQTLLKNKYGSVAYNSDGLKIAIASYTRAGTFDDVAFNMEYPDIDLSKFRNEPTIVKTVRVTKKVA